MTSRAYDIDGVLVDYVSDVFLKLASMAGYKELSAAEQDYDFCKLYNMPRENLIGMYKEYGHIVPELMRRCEPLDILNPLPGDYLVTARGSTDDMTYNKEVRDATREWVQKYYPDTVLLFTNDSDKARLCKTLGASELVEDRPRTMLDCKAVGLPVRAVLWYYNEPTIVKHNIEVVASMMWD